MNEFYVEQLIPSKIDQKARLIKIVCTILMAIAFIAGVIIPLGFLVGIALLIVNVVVLKGSSIEYEYLYLNGNLDIDKIIAKQKRKQAFTTNINEMIVIAPLNSGEVQPYQGVKVTDYTSGNGQQKVYKMVTMKDSQKVAILIEPNEAILNAMRMIAPRKVFI